MRKPGGEGGRRAGVSDCRQRETELGCGQKQQETRERELGNKIYWSQACIITVVCSTIWHRQQGIQEFMNGS